jgi:bifunctional non-homologous end joining protein LigD
MPLEEYAAKRRFEKTPEPGPAKERDSRFPPHYFCVQRHDATRLHYDFRLEVGGVSSRGPFPKVQPSIPT